MMKARRRQTKGKERDTRHMAIQLVVEGETMLREQRKRRKGVKWGIERGGVEGVKGVGEEGVGGGPQGRIRV